MSELKASFLITPPYLNPGDRIGIIAPARKISEEELAPALKKLAAKGFETVLGRHIYAGRDQFAGSDLQRASDLQTMIDDTSIKAILCARGGYGTVRLINLVNFDNLYKNPKWIAGYSDITVLHSYINQILGVETIHGTMPINFKEQDSDPEALETLIKALTGKALTYEFPSHPLNKPGKAEAIITGGNLSVLYSLRGTKMDLDTNQRILFLEDLDEYLYHIDRMMMNLRLGKKLSCINALVIGSMSEMKDNTVPFGKDACEIIHQVVGCTTFPVCYGFPAGHIKNNYALILGRNVSLTIGPEKTELKFEEK